MTFRKFLQKNAYHANMYCLSKQLAISSYFSDLLAKMFFLGCHKEDDVTKHCSLRPLIEAAEAASFGVAYRGRLDIAKLWTFLIAESSQGFFIVSLENIDG